MTTTPNWKSFWRTLRLLGSKALTKVPRGLKGVIDDTATQTDDFWSQMLVDCFLFEWKELDSAEFAVEMALREYAANVRGALQSFADEHNVDAICETSNAKVIGFLVKAAHRSPKPPLQTPTVIPAPDLKSEK